MLAQRIAACISQHAISAGQSLYPKARLHDLATAALGRQSKKHKPLVPEYHHFTIQPKNIPVPDGAKILAPHQGGESEEKGDSNDQKLSEQNKIGHFHSPKQFVSMAKLVQHPMDSVEQLEEATLFSMRYNL